MRNTITENARAMMYMDSLELCTFGKGGQFWGYHFLEEFKQRRGYDLTPYLPFIIKEAGMMQVDFTYHYYMEDTNFSAKLYNDLYQTMTDMYMVNMLKPMQEWLHSIGMTLRAEISYGLPFEISQPGKYVDGIETESLEFASQIEPYRSLAGAAHIYNRTYSSETGATLLNYMMGLDFYTQIIYTQFAAGVTKTVLHGYSSIAGAKESTCWPGHEGMWPIFSERFGMRQPAYQHYNDWTDMVARYQMILRQGKPRMDLGMLRLDYNFNNMYFAGIDERTLYEEQLMRGHAGVYWKDMTLQDAGYTWDYFAPQLLEEDFVDVGGQVMMPEGPGYQALIIYQEMLPVATAGKLLAMAEKGPSIVFVNGVTETIRPMGISKTHVKAASMTPFHDKHDEELRALIKEMKMLPNVVEVDNQSQTYAALTKMGIKPRTEFAEPNQNILTLLKEDGSNTYFYAYNKQYKDKMIAKVCESGNYKVKFSNGTVTQFEAFVRDNIFLKEWQLVVEDWNEGDKVTIEEDRGQGVITHEIYYETKKTRIDAGSVTLKPWKDMEAVGPDVSGVGYYTTSVTLPEDWNETDGAILKIGSTNTNTAAVYVNGQKARAVDFDALSVDISELLQTGENTILVEVSSTLNNRLLARGYYDAVAKKSKMLSDNANNAFEGEGGDAETGKPDGLNFDVHTTVHDYGMTGDVTLIT